MRFVIGVLSMFLASCVTVPPPPVSCVQVVNDFGATQQVGEEPAMQELPGAAFFGLINKKAGVMRMLVLVVDPAVVTTLKATGIFTVTQVCVMPEGAPYKEATVMTGVDMTKEEPRTPVRHPGRRCE